MSNTVEVDPAALNAEVDGILNGVHVEPQGPTAEEQAAAAAEAERAAEYEQAEKAANSYLPGCMAAWVGISKVLMPNWNLTPSEVDAMAKCTASALGWWFPHLAIHPKWMALVGVGGTFYGIAASRRDPQTGKVRPMRAPAQAEQGEQQQGDAAAAA